MEPCVDVSQTDATCYSPPPVFDVPQPIWCLEPTTVGPPSTEEPTTVITETTTSWISSAISSTVSSTTSVFNTTQVPATTASTAEPIESTAARFTTIAFEYCLSNPCQNDGTCENLSDGFTCDCSGTGYTGDECTLHVAAVVVPVVVIAILIIVLIILCCCKECCKQRCQQCCEQPGLFFCICYKKKRKNEENTTGMSYNSQKSTVGLINGPDEEDGAEKTSPPGKETFSYKNEEISLTENENGAPPKDEKGAEEKMAPIVPVTEL